MIYLFAGDDSKNKLLIYERFIKSVPENEEFFSISRNDFNRTQIESLYSGAGLFFSKCIVIFENILDYEENRNFILEKLKLMSESPNSFVFLEGN